jgi:shikimate dehydrogenase
MADQLRRRCAVLGSPISHSLSPVLHRAGYRAVGLDWRYDAIEVREDQLAGFLAGLDETWRGLSLTMPLKRTAVGLVDELTARAAQAGAVNTVVLDRGRRTGHNTDVPGAVAAIRAVAAGPLRRAVVLGGGATATSVLLALADLGCRDVRLVVRDAARAEETLAAVARHPSAPAMEVLGFGAAAAPADILVSTIPAAAQTTDVLSLAEPVEVVFDVVYHPWPTPLAAFALDRGRTLVSGLDLLVHQAGAQFTLMTGAGDPPLAAMREAGERALAADAGPGQ